MRRVSVSSLGSGRQAGSVVDVAFVVGADWGFTDSWGGGWTLSRRQGPRLTHPDVLADHIIVPTSARLHRLRNFFQHVASPGRKIIMSAHVTISCLPPPRPSIIMFWNLISVSFSYPHSRI